MSSEDVLRAYGAQKMSPSATNVSICWKVKETSAGYTEDVWRTLMSTVHFLWIASSGSRLRPWRSEYLRWRMETYTGKAAGTIRLRDFIGMFLAEPRQMNRFFRWVSAMRRLVDG